MWNLIYVERQGSQLVRAEEAHNTLKHSLVQRKCGDGSAHTINVRQSAMQRDPMKVNIVKMRHVT